MLFKRGVTEKPELPKEYTWELDVLGEDHTYSCVVHENEVVTYEDGVEKKHLKVMNPECRQGVLQIDTNTSLFGDLVPFQLERYIPYIKLQGEWVSSDTTKKDRLDATVAAYRRNAKLEIIVGILFILAAFLKKLITGETGDWYMVTVFGIFFIFAGLSTRVRLKQELDAMKEAEQKEQQEETEEIVEEKVEEVVEKPMMIDGIPQGIGAPKQRKDEE